MKKILIAFLIIITTASLTACKKKIVDEDPQTILNKAWEKQLDKERDFKQGSIAINGKANFEFSNSNVALQGSGTLRFDSPEEGHQKAALVADIKANGKIEGKTADVSFKGEARWLEKKTYILFDKLSFETDDPQTNLMANLIANMYQSQWIELPFDIFDRATAKIYTPAPQQSKAILDIAKKNNFFDVKKDLGNRTFVVAVNQEKLNKYLNEVSAVQGTALPTGYADSIANFLNETSSALQVTINDEYDLTAVKVNINAAHEERKENLSITLDWKSDGKKSSGTGELILAGLMPGKFSGSFTSEWDKKALPIEVPKDAKSFDLGALIPGLTAPQQ